MTGRKRKLCRIWLAVVLATVLFIPFGAAVATNVGSKGSSSGGSYENEWHSNDLRDPVTGRRASFDTWSPYVGMHVGPGYILQMTDELKLDFYGKWFWTRIFKRKADVAGDTYNFDDIDSCRLRFGTRVDRNISEQNDIYAGVAWEHEFNGKAKAMTYGFDVPSPSVKGNT